MATGSQQPRDLCTALTESVRAARRRREGADPSPPIGHETGEYDCSTCLDTRRVTLDASGQATARRDEPTTIATCPDCSASWRELDDPWAATPQELAEDLEPF